MAKQNKNYDYRSGAGLLKQQQSALNKKFQAMSPTQKKAYIAKQAKAIGKTTAQVASMQGGAGLARSAGAKVGAKIALKIDNKVQRNIRGYKLEKKSLKAANTPAKGSKATQARARGKEYQRIVDTNIINKVGFKDKGLQTRSKIYKARKGPGWIGGDSYIKVSKKK